MANRIGIRFGGSETVQESVAIVREAAAAGASSVWMTEHLGYRESMVSCMAFLLAAEEVTVVPAAVTPFLWHPTPTAMSLATLAEAAPGRVAVAAGIGNLLDLKESGVVPEEPADALRDFVAGLRALLAGETVEMSGRTFRLDGARLTFAPVEAVPIFVTALGEDVAAMAGAVGDGLHLSAGLSAAFSARCIAAAKDAARAEGRDADGMPAAGFLYFAAAKEKKAAVEKLRGQLAFLLRNRMMADNIAASGLPVDQDAIVEAVAKRDMERAASLVSDDAVEAFTVCGTPDDCCRRLEAYLAAGMTEPVIEVRGNAEQRALALGIIREFAAG